MLEGVAGTAPQQQLGNPIVHAVGRRRPQRDARAFESIEERFEPAQCDTVGETGLRLGSTLLANEALAGGEPGT